LTRKGLIWQNDLMILIEMKILTHIMRKRHFLMMKGVHRWGIMTMNNHEYLNNVFKEAQVLLMTSIVEITFYKSVKYFAQRRTHVE
jgi:hypothetical protein